MTKIQNVKPVKGFSTQDVKSRLGGKPLNLCLINPLNLQLC